MTTNVKPQNLYDLCEDVCNAIALRPLNYNQGNWAIDADKVMTAEEACGTAFCRAGWMVALVDEPRTPAEWTSLPDSYIADKAELMLLNAGIPESDINQLFSGSACFDEDDANGLDGISYPEPGTPLYVQRGIEGMREFMFKYEKKLKAAKIYYNDQAPKQDSK